MKHLLTISLICIATLRLSAQSDCNSAVSVCDFVYDENNSPAGTGTVVEAAPGSCQTGGEFNSAWYIFSPQTDGLFGFVLQPNDVADDYDWSLFDITDNGCAGINTGASPEISCNSYGEFAGTPNGPTGISTADGGSGNFNGPGNAAGPPFNEDISVTAGNVYALVVMNFSSTLNGYALDFGNTAVSIFDNTPPAIESLTSNWCTGEVVIQLTEEIDVSTLTATDFLINTPGITVTSFSTNTPNLASELNFVLGPLPLPAGLQVELTTINSEILADICDNELPQPIAIDLSGNFFFEAITTPGCNSTGAIIDMNLLGNAPNAPYTMTLDGAPQASFTADNLATGSYVIEITDNTGCSRDTTVSVVSLTSTVTMPANAVLCDLSDTFTAQFNGGLILWDAPAGVTVAFPAQGTTLISADAPGTYTLEATVTNQGCTSTGSFEVQFNYPPQSTTAVTPASCFGICDGTVSVTNENPAGLTILLDGTSTTGQPAEITAVCPGQYELEVIFSPECSTTQQITIAHPPPVSASFEADLWIVPYASPTVTLTSTSENADSLLWTVVGADSLIWSDTLWILTLPQEPAIYPIQLVAADTSGCTSFFEAFIEVRDEFRVFVPNSFTPNDDGINDFIVPSFTYEPVFYRWQIFNRYGDVVFDSKDYREVWMGEHRNGGYYVPTGVYSYVLTTRGVERDMQTLKGTISLVR
jgi:gliding motility-associated-like protein